MALIAKLVVDKQMMTDAVERAVAEFHPVTEGRMMALRYALRLLRCAAFDHAVVIEDGWARCSRCLWRERLLGTEDAL